MIANLSIASKLAIRELRGGLSGFYVLVACIMLGVTAITTVGVLSTALKSGLGDQGRVLLGGDLSFALVHKATNRRAACFYRRFWRHQLNRHLALDCALKNARIDRCTS